MNEVTFTKSTAKKYAASNTNVSFCSAWRVRYVPKLIINMLYFAAYLYLTPTFYDLIDNAVSNDSN